MKIIRGIVPLFLICLLIDFACASEPKTGSDLASEADRQPVDIGLFARVVTSDPARNDGARSGRLDEFRAEDVFLDREVAPATDGPYVVPAWPDGKACIGLRWDERRMLTRLELPLAGSSPAPARQIPEVQYWSSEGREDSWSGIGQTAWQGKWKRLPGKMEVRGDRLIWQVSREDVPEFRQASGTLAVRWVFSGGPVPLRVRRPAVWSDSRWATGDFCCEMRHGKASGPMTTSLYNGQFLQRETGSMLLQRVWDPVKPTVLTIRYAVPEQRKADRTLVRFATPAGGFSVAVEDVLNTDGVYVPDFGVYFARHAAGLTLDRYLENHRDRQTILQQVRKLPEQTLDRAMQALWRPIQNNGPTMLSLAADNEKWVVDRDGTIRYGPLTVVPSFGPGTAQLVRMDFGQIGIRSTVWPPGVEKGLPLQIADKTFLEGIGLHANAELRIRLNGCYLAFEAMVGMFPSGHGGATATCQIDVDGQRRFDSGVMKQQQPARPIKVPLAGAAEMVLRLTDAGDGILNDAVNLAEARLIPADAEKHSQPLYVSRLFQECRPQTTRHLEGRWLPIMMHETRHGESICKERVYVAPHERSSPALSTIGKCRAIGVAEFSIENVGPKKIEERLGLHFRLEKGGALGLEVTGGRAIVKQGSRVMACVEFADPFPLRVTAKDGSLIFSGETPPRTALRWTLLIPGWELKTGQPSAFRRAEAYRDDVAAYWGQLLAPAMQIEVPEPLLEDLFQATQVHAMIAARNEDAGARIAPWCAAATYGPLDTEAQPVILAMDLLGHHEFARRSLEFFLASYREQGFLAKGYTLMGTGQNLWTLGEHQALTRDAEWLARIAPKLVKACRWIQRQTEKTRRIDAQGEKVPEYGLAPPGVLADWDRYAYYFYANAHFCAGMEAIARALGEIRHPETEAIRRAAAEYRENVLRAFRFQQDRMPVVPLRDGTWVPPCPSSLYCYGLTRDFYGGVSAIGHDVEVGGNHLIPLGLLDPRARQADWIVDYLEDRWFFIDGIFGAYPAAENEKDWFARGGFSKLQPHYTRTADLHALRDDVKPFLRTYFNTFPVLLNRENLTYWEHMNNGGAWNKTHESAWFLEMTRTMLVAERGDQLWLAPFVPRHWLRKGAAVRVRNAPTHFGKVSYSLRRSAAEDAIEAVVEPPTRNVPDRLVLRVRHPEGKPIRKATVDDAPHPGFDPVGETITLQRIARPVRLVIRY